MLAITTSFTGCATPEARNIHIADSILKSKFDPNLAEISAAAAGFKKNDFSMEKLRKYSDTALSHLYDALLRITFFFPDSDNYTNLQENLLEEKILRGKQTNFDVERMHKTYISVRMFEKAFVLRKQFPAAKFQYVPATILDNTNGETTWRVYDVSPGAEKATLETLPIGSGAKVIMAIFPSCPAAENAMDNIMADPEISTVFKRYGVLLTRRFETKGVLHWRNNYNFPEVYITHKASDFPGIDLHSSPNFYFLKDGKIKFSFDGWSNEKNPNYGLINMRKGLEVISISLVQHSPQ